MDLAKASSKLDNKICSDRELKATDATMSEAYFMLLSSIKDEQIHASLIASQRRWLKERENDLSDLTHWNDGRNAPDDNQHRIILLSAMRQRTKELASYSGTQPNFITVALKQRKLACAYSGGALAGYQGSCSFIPDQTNLNYKTYNCFGNRSYQNGNRTCSENNDFACNTTEITKNVTIIHNSNLKSITS